MENERNLVWVRIGGVAAILLAILQLAAFWVYIAGFGLIFIGLSAAVVWALFVYLRQFESTNLLRYALAAFAIGFIANLIRITIPSIDSLYLFFGGLFVNISLVLFAYSSLKARAIPNLVSWSGLIGNVLVIVLLGILQTSFSILMLRALELATFLQGIFLAGMGVRMLYPKAADGDEDEVKEVSLEWYQSGAFQKGLIGWFVFNGIYWWISLFFSDAVILLWPLLILINVGALLFYASKNRMLAFGLLMAFPLNFAVLLLRGMTEQAICFSPFFIDIGFFY